MTRFFKRYFSSLKFRIFLLLLIFGILPGFAVRACVVTTYQNHAVSERTNEIISQIRLLSAQMVYEDYLPDASDESISRQLEQLGAIYDARIFLVDSGFRIAQDTWHLEEGKYSLDEAVLRAWSGQDVMEKSLRADQIRIALALSGDREDQPMGIVCVTSSTAFMKAGLDRIRQIMTIVQLALIAALFFIGFLLSGSLVRPFLRLTESIQAVQEGYQSNFEPVETFTETQRMSDACSDMLGRLSQMDQSREEFVSNVSHELKTPLTSMKVLSESLLGQEDVPNEIYRDFMKDIAGEIDRENSIINDLLSLVRLNRDSTALDVKSVSINEMLDLLMKRLRPIAEKQQVDLFLESFRPVSAEVDEGKLTLAFSNLIENAIKYNRPEGYVHVTLNADHQNFFLNVIDNGIGIPKEAQAHIFERFYRVDKSHSREIGGTGLGLAITRSVIVMHHGAIRVHSEEGEGTTFTVRIPLVYVSKAP